MDGRRSNPGGGKTHPPADSPEPTPPRPNLKDERPPAGANPVRVPYVTRNTLGSGN
jgi:hypothetical protein